ncbi:MAG: multidrug effflux MFS transporter [Puniceicoccales bacterium]|nr:multidrug effflux MFS transporter [Puniceicoccales bacterium]
MSANSDSTDIPETIAGAARARLLCILALLAAFGPFATDMYLPALPRITSDLGATAGSVQLSLSVFFVGVSAGQLIYGPVSDALGRRRPLLFGMVLFAVSAVVCAFATTVETLVAWRFVMGIGGSAGMTLSRAVVRDKFPHDSAAAFSVLMIIMGAAPMLAPIAGEQLLRLETWGAALGMFAGWRAIFAVLAAIGLAALAAVFWGLPESLPPQKRRKLGLGEALAGYRSLLGRRQFTGYTLVMGFSAGAMFAYITCSAHVFINIYGVTPLDFSLIFAGNALGLLGASALNWRLLHHFSPGKILLVASVCAALAGLTLVACAATGAGGFWGMLALLFLSLASGGFVGPNAQALALAPCGHAAGTAAALLGTVQFGMGGLTGAVASHFGDSASALPMCAVFAFCTIFGLFSLILTGNRRMSSPFS